MTYVACLAVGIIVGLVATLYALAECNLIRGQIRAPRQSDRRTVERKPTPEPTPTPKPEPTPESKGNWLTRRRGEGLDAKPARRPMTAYATDDQAAPKANARRPDPPKAHGGPPAPKAPKFTADDLKGALVNLGYKAKDSKKCAKETMARKPPDLATALRWALK